MIKKKIRNKMKKISQKIKYRINILKSVGKKKEKDYFFNDSGNLIIKKRGFNEIVINN